MLSHSAPRAKLLHNAAVRSRILRSLSQTSIRFPPKFRTTCLRQSNTFSKPRNSTKPHYSVDLAASFWIYLSRQVQPLNTAKMPQNEYMERWRKLHGRRLDHEERHRKRTAREGHKSSQDAQKLTGLRAKLNQQKRHLEKIQMKKQIKAHEERNVKNDAPAEPSSTPLPQYLLDRSNPSNAKCDVQ